MWEPLSVSTMSLISPTLRLNVTSSNGFCIWPRPKGPTNSIYKRLPSNLSNKKQEHMRIGRNYLITERRKEVKLHSFNQKQNRKLDSILGSVGHYYSSARGGKGYKLVHCLLTSQPQDHNWATLMIIRWPIPPNGSNRVVQCQNSALNQVTSKNRRGRIREQFTQLLKCLTTLVLLARTRTCINTYFYMFEAWSRNFWSWIEGK